MYPVAATVVSDGSHATRRGLTVRFDIFISVDPLKMFSISRRDFFNILPDVHLSKVSHSPPITAMAIFGLSSPVYGR